MRACTEYHRESDEPRPTTADVTPGRNRESLKPWRGRERLRRSSGRAAGAAVPSTRLSLHPSLSPRLSLRPTLVVPWSCKCFTTKLGSQPQSSFSFPATPPFFSSARLRLIGVNAYIGSWVLVLIGLGTNTRKRKNKTGILIGERRGTTKKYRNVKKRDRNGVKPRKTVIVVDQGRSRMITDDQGRSRTITDFFRP